MDQSLAYFNGDFVPQADTRLAVDDVGVVTGATLTERIRTYGGRLAFVDEHLARLADGLGVLGIELPEQGRLASIAEELVERNADAYPHDFAVVFLITPGRPNDRATCCLTVVPQPRAVWATGYETGWAIHTSNLSAIPTSTMPRDVKHRSRLHWYLASQALPESNQPIEPLLLDSDGIVTETSYGNVLAVTGQTITAVSRGRALPGVTEAAALRIAGKLGFSVEFSDLTGQELRSADEVLLTSTGYTIAPVTVIDNNPIGLKTPGPVWHQLANAFSNEVGLDFVAQAKALRDGK